MREDRKRQIEAVALEALGRTAAERTAYLDAACADDPGLRRDVDSLLAGQGEAAALLESPPWAVPTALLAPGTRLGPYEIESVIGAGGMGEVYRGRDTRLGRSVAIKVLPPALADDPQRRRRFEQEARVVSALNHPHICPLFDVGEAVPSSQASLATSAESRAPVHYLVLAYLEGQTLGTRLRKGALPLSHVLDLGAQMADALSAAHKAGIVHRDLKPSNVMLMKAPAGVNGASGLHATLLDFGLAKLTGHGERAAIDADWKASGPVQTVPGIVLGTVPYMAPEQVEGRAADARTDMWALGAVLYEMVTGRRAFDGETPTLVAAAILEREPTPLEALQPGVPPALAHVIAKCLAKDPDARWDTAHDVADELRWIARSTPADAGRPWRPGPRLLAAAVTAALLVFAAGGGLTWLVRPADRAGPVAHARLSLDVRPADEVNAGGVRPLFVFTPGGSRTALAWTPDGQSLVFVGRSNGVQQLYVRRLEDAEARPLAGTEGAQVPAVSHDGQWVAFWSARAIRKVPIGGGPVTELAAGVASPPYGMAWDDLGGLFFGRYADQGIWQTPPGGAPIAVTTLREAEVQHALPCPLPGGRALLYTARKRELSWGDEQVVAHTLATGERKVLLQDAADARYLPSGHLVFLRRGTLFAVLFDARRLEVQGSPVAVLDNVVQALTSRHSSDVTGAGQFAVAPTGALALIRGPVIPYEERELAVVDRRGQITELPGGPHTYWASVRLSPDGRRLAVVVSEQTEAGLWLYDLGRETLTPLSRGGETDWTAWSPDGRRLAFSWLKDGQWSLAVQPADGTSAPQPLLAGRFKPLSWSPDGRELLGIHANDIVVATLDGDSPGVRPLFETSDTEGSPALSPNGRWLAYESNASGRQEVYVQPYPGPGAAQQVSRGGGSDPAWNPSGNELFFLSPRDPAGRQSMLVAEFRAGRSAVEATRIGQPQRLFEVASGLAFGCDPLRCYDVSADGQRFYAWWRRPAPPRPPVTHIDLILSWVDEVKAKVPAK